MYCRIFFLKLLVVLFSGFTFNVYAFYATPPENIPASEKGKFNSLIPYEQNSILFKSTENDNNATEINISMRYNFRANDGNATASFHGFNPFFSYTSKSDFYWMLQDTRSSAPIISRYQNHAFHFRFDKVEGDNSQWLGKYWNWFDVGIEHISNGQAFTAQLNKQATINAYNSNDRTLLDSISRADATVVLTAEVSKQLVWFHRTDINVKLFAKRWGQEADVYWGPYANQDVNFNDFQLVRIQTATPLESLCVHCRFNAEWTLGAKGLATDSWNFMLDLPVMMFDNYTVPMSITAHRGPMNNLSNYTDSQNTLAIGFNFSY